MIFSDETVGTNVPKNYVPAIETGFRNSCQVGQLAGQKITGIRFRLQDGDNHCVDSSDWAFQQAAEGAMKQGKCFFSSIELVQLIYRINFK